MVGEASRFDSYPYYIHMQKEVDRLSANDNEREHTNSDFRVAISQLTANVDRLVTISEKHEEKITELSNIELRRKGSMKILAAELTVVVAIISSVIAGAFVRFL